jgi:aerobic-type carbon monoxide dehydrogenase small subunit (CoxS/CutS family)
LSSLCQVTVEVNGRRLDAQVEPRRLLSDFLRHDLGLTGTHVGCEQGACGACTVLLGGEAVRSCLLFAVQVDGARITTVEGLAWDEALTELQESFHRHHALQCGYCTAGFLMTLGDHFARGDLDEDVREVVSGNLCRCTGYVGIVEAVTEHADRLRDRRR